MVCPQLALSHHNVGFTDGAAAPAMISSGNTRGTRVTVLLGLTGAIALAWLYLLRGAELEMRAMDAGVGDMMSMVSPWTAGYAMRVLAMWAVMMAAMMLPAALPTICLMTSLPRRRPEDVSGTRAAMFFTAGFLGVWMGFGGAATLIQW